MGIPYGLQEWKMLKKVTIKTFKTWTQIRKSTPDLKFRSVVATPDLSQISGQIGMFWLRSVVRSGVDH